MSMNSALDALEAASDAASVPRAAVFQPKVKPRARKGGGGRGGGGSGGGERSADKPPQAARREKATLTPVERTPLITPAEIVVPAVEKLKESNGEELSAPCPDGTTPAIDVVAVSSSQNDVGQQFWSQVDVGQDFRSQIDAGQAQRLSFREGSKVLEETTDRNVALGLEGEGDREISEERGVDGDRVRAEESGGEGERERADGRGEKDERERVEERGERADGRGGEDERGRVEERGEEEEERESAEERVGEEERERERERAEERAGEERERAEEREGEEERERAEERGGEEEEEEEEEEEWPVVAEVEEEAEIVSEVVASGRGGRKRKFPHSTSQARVNRTERDGVALKVDFSKTDLSNPGKLTMREIIRRAEAIERKKLKADGNKKPAQNDGKQKHASTVEAAERGSAVGMAPQVQVINGRIVINEQSLTVGAYATSRLNTDTYTRIEENAPRLNYNSYRDKASTERWKVDDTDVFYLALKQFGTDFELIQNLFPGRTRRQVKAKFKKEERNNPRRLQEALAHRPNDQAHYTDMITRLKGDEADPSCDDPFANILG